MQCTGISIIYLLYTHGYKYYLEGLNVKDVIQNQSIF